MEKRALARIALAGPGAIVAAVLILLAMPLWLPPGAAEVDNLILPLMVFPLIWAMLFFHACLDVRLGRIVLIMLGVSLVNAAILGWHFRPLLAQVVTAETRR